MKTFALIDCNNFFVSCERVFNPKIQNTPTLVLSCNDGCAISRSQEIKDMGISMGIPYFIIKKNFNVSKMAVFSTNFKLYKDMSDRVMRIIEEFSPEIDVYSIDEAFIDLSHVKNPEKFCKELQIKIKKYTGIPVSIGIAPTKTLAKLANRLAKENKIPVFKIKGEIQINEVLKSASAGKIWGIGSRISLELTKFGIDTAFSLTNQSDQWIRKNFGIGLLRLVHELKGISCLSMESVKESRKSIISSRSFGKATNDFKNLFSAVSFHIANASQQMREEGNAAKLMSVSIYTDRYKDVPQHSRVESIVFDKPVSDTLTLTKYARGVLKSIYEEGYEYKKTGITLSDFVPENSCQVADLFGEKTFENHKLMESIDSLNLIYGKGAVKLASEGIDKEWKPNTRFISGEFTTKWSDIPRVRKVNL